MPPAYDLGGSDVASTADFLSAMRNMDPNIIRAAAAVQGAPDPTLVTTRNGQLADAAPGNPNNPITAGMAPPAVDWGSDPTVRAYWQAMAAAAQQPQGAPSGGGGQQSISGYLNQLVGPPPSASDFGPAPTLSDFFSATPYNQALAALASGVKNAQGQIGSAYSNANAAMNQIAGLISQNGAAQTKQMSAAEQAAVNAMNGYAKNAEALAGPGGGVAARMAGLQGTLAGQQGAQNALAATLTGIQNFNAQQDKAAVGLNQQAALGSLAAANSSEQSKIQLQMAADEAKAQQMLAAANNARGTAMAKAQQDYVNARNAVLNDATKLAASGQTSTSNQDAALNTMTGWANSGNANGTALNSAASNILSGTKPDGTPVMVNGKAVGKASTYGEAMSRLNSSGLNPASPEYKLLAGMLGQYFSNGKTSNSQDSLMNALAQMASAYGG